MKENSNFMSVRAKTKLEARLQLVEERLIETTKSLGDAGGTSEWHDNPALEEVHRQIGMLEIESRTLKAKLTDPIIVKPRTETDEVGMGNTIQVELLEIEETLTLNILGSIDAGLYRDSLSIESPLGQAVIGKKIGDITQYQLQNRTFRAKIVEILPGNY